MRILIKTLFVLAFLLIITPAIANSPIPDEAFKEWLDSIRTNIGSSDKAGLLKQFTDKKVFACTFYISKQGNPEKLMLFRSTGDKSLDISAMGLVSKSTSLPVCPYNQNRMVVFTLKNGSIQLSQAGYR